MTLSASLDMCRSRNRWRVSIVPTLLVVSQVSSMCWIVGGWHASSVQGLGARDPAGELTGSGSATVIFCRQPHPSSKTRPVICEIHESTSPVRTHLASVSGLAVSSLATIRIVSLVKPGETETPFSPSAGDVKRR